MTKPLTEDRRAELLRSLPAWKIFCAESVAMEQRLKSKKQGATLLELIIEVPNG